MASTSELKSLEYKNSEQTGGDHTEDKTWAEIVADYEYHSENEIEVTKCCCYTPIKDKDKFLYEDKNVLALACYWILKEMDLSKSISCLMNEFNNVVSVISNCDCELQYKLAVVDYYMRQRHEILHRYSLMAAGLDAETSDQSFSNVTAIKSTRTPDKIIVLGDVIIIIETTATTNKGKSYISKGKIEEGFQSKYEVEIRELEQNGYKCEYITLVYDIKDVSSSEYLHDLNKICSLTDSNINKSALDDLEMLRRSFCNLTHMYNKRLAPYMSILFTNDFVPNYFPDSVKELLTVKDQYSSFKYTRIATNPGIYNRIVNSWVRLPRLLEMAETADTLVITLDLITNRLKFIPSKSAGLTNFEWQDVISNGDKPTLIKNLVLQAGSASNLESSGNIEFFDKTTNVKRDDYIFNLNLMLHPGSKMIRSNLLPDKQYNENVDLWADLKCKYLNDDYEIVLEGLIDNIVSMSENDLDHMMNSLTSKRPFIVSEISSHMFESSKNLYDLRYKQLNDFSQDTRSILHQKPSFTYPLFNSNLSAYTDYKNKNVNFIRSLKDEGLGPYTDIILVNVLSDNFKFGSKPKQIPEEVRKTQNDLSELQRQMFKIQINQKDDNGRLRPAKEIAECSVVLEQMKSIRIKMKVLNTKYNYNGKEISVCRLPTKSKKKRRKGDNNKKSTILGSKFSEEMEHFRKKGEVANYKGVGIYSNNILRAEFEALKIKLLSPTADECPDELFDNFVGHDVTLLMQLKRQTLDDIGEAYSQLKRTNIYHSSAFVSRLCFSLLYFSQSSIGSDYIFADNLGYNNVLLLCKGGKKIFKTKKSKLFRLVYPTYAEAITQFQRPGYNSNYRVLIINGINYIVTPWQVLDETLLVDGLSFLHKTMGFVLLNRRLNNDIHASLSTCYFNIILAYNARRQTEEFMHNMRYITVNCMSEFSNLEKMLPELAGFNYDFLQCYIRNSLSENFVVTSNMLKAFHDNCGNDSRGYLLANPVPHMFDDTVFIDSPEQLTLVIYCTFIMSKAPVTQSLEQIHNLKTMLETHNVHKLNCHDNLSDKYDYDMEYLTDGKTFECYWNGLFENDFKYDPQFVSTLGKFMGDYLIDVIGTEEALSKWNQILSKPWNMFANTNGLRGERNKKDFFGKKGYYVVYNDVLKDESYMNKILTVLNNDDTDHEKRKSLDSLNQTFCKKLNTTTLDMCVFHVVDKRQRGGSREIFVMDLNTKIYQQPIEKYTAFLCKNVPNEMISVPSNRRLFNLHTNVHERFKSESGMIYNCVFDCRRWAPHSTITKFIDFILSMKHFLPSSFVTHSLYMFEKMLKKRVYTRKYIYEQLVGNKNNVKFSHMLTKDEETEGFYFEMSYSWMMGIYNYLSSLLHVANQMYASYIISKSFTRVLGQDVIIHMNAHSDDSAGKIVVSDRSQLKKIILIYELLLKCSNHMLSDKKCNIGRTYFEFLSVLYLGGELMTLMPKFAGSFTFHPTDGGYCNDITDAYSKCVELIVNGATFEQAYLAMKVNAYMIWRFYFGKNVDGIAYDYPPQLTGMPDAHPINVLLCGSDADLIRLSFKKDGITLPLIMKLSKMLTEFQTVEDCFIKPLSAKPNIIIGSEYKNLSNLLSIETDEALNWIITNTSFNKTPLQLLSYLNKCKDKTFIASLQDETLTRRISRAYFFKTASCIDLKFGTWTYQQIRELLNALAFAIQAEDVNDEYKIWADELKNDPGDVEASNLFLMMHSEMVSLNKSMQSISYTHDQIVSSQKTTKPVHINIQRIVNVLTSDYQPDALTIWIKFNKYRWIVPPGDYTVQFNNINDLFCQRGFEINNIPASWLYKLLTKYKGKYVKEYFIYSNVPSGCRDVNNYKDVLFYLAHNSFQNSYINGIISPYGRTMNLTFDQIFEEYIDDKLLKSIHILDFLSGAFHDKRMMELINQLKPNNTELFGFEGLLNVLTTNNNEHVNKSLIKEMVSPHFNCAINCSHDGTIPHAQWMKNSYFYCFTKRQTLIGNVWLGKGSLYINLPVLKFELSLENMKINGACLNTTSYTLNKHEVAYIDYVLANAQLPTLKSHLVPCDPRDWMKIGFGVDEKGNLSISQKRYLKNTIKNIVITKAPNKTLSNIDLCQIQIMPRLKYKVDYLEYGEYMKSYIIHSFDMPVKGMLRTLTELYDNEYNRKLSANLGKDFNNFLEQVIGVTSESELYIDFKTLVDSYKYTQLYKIFFGADKREDVNFKTLKVRAKKYPGQEGGLLDIFIKQKIADSNFLFEYDRIMTPELMYLKSTQPESFISNLTTNIKEKYDALYTNVDKTLIIRSLGEILNSINDIDFEKTLMGVLYNWGYVGVLGALEIEIKMRSVDNFSIIRKIPDSSLQQKLAHDIVKSFINVLYNCSNEYTRMSHEFATVDETFLLDEFQRNMKSFINISSMSYFGAMSFIANRPSRIFNMLKGWLGTILNSGLEEYFNKEISRNQWLMMLPFNINVLDNWIMMIQTCLSNLYSVYGQKYDLKNYLRLQRLPDNVYSIKAIAQNIFGDTKIELPKFMYFNGIWNGVYYDRISGPMIIKTSQGIYRLEPIITRLSNKLVPLRTQFWLRMPLDEEYLDTDEGEELIMELDNSDIDLDSINDYINSAMYVGSTKKNVYIKDKYKVKKGVNMKVHIVEAFGKSKDLNLHKKIRQIGETIILFTDVLIDSFIQYGGCEVQCFKLKNVQPQNKTVIQPECIIIYVIDSHAVDIELFERFLNAKYVPKEVLVEELTNSIFLTYFDDLGEKVDDRNLEEPTEELKNIYSKAERIRAQKEKENSLAESDLAESFDMALIEVQSLNKKYYDEDTIKKYKKSIKDISEHGAASLQTLEKYLRAIRESKGSIEKILGGIEDITSKPQTADFFEKVFEVPAAFQVGQSKQSDIKNRALKDPRLRAELESLYPGLTNSLLSNRLYISSKKQKSLRSQVNMWKLVISSPEISGDKMQKKFIIDLFTTVLNDANIITDSKHDNTWEVMRDKITEEIMEESDGSDVEVNYQDPPGEGDLRYRIF